MKTIAYYLNDIQLPGQRVLHDEYNSSEDEPDPAESLALHKVHLRLISVLKWMTALYGVGESILDKIFAVLC